MEYKQTARSPHYGKIFAYDETGKQVQELDILKIKLVHNGKEYTVGQLFELAFKMEDENIALKNRVLEVEVKVSAQAQTNILLKETLSALNKKIDEVASKNTII